MVEPLHGLWREGWRDALAVLFPVECAGCGAPDRGLCVECRMLLSIAESGQMSEQVLPDTTRVVSAVRYEGALRHMILGFKEQGRTDVVKAFAGPLRVAIESAARGPSADAHRSTGESAGQDVGGSDQGVEVCPVPSSKHSLRRRGYRPVEVLARSAGFRLAHVLTHSALAAGATAEQKSLDITERGLNLHGAFVAVSAARGRRFVIVDDVVTSGATLREAARALREGGAEVVGAATLAATPRRNARYGAFLVHARDIHSQGGYGG